MSKAQQQRADWLVENSFTIMALMLTGVALVVTSMHVMQIPKEVWERPYVAALETFQVVDQALSVLFLGIVLALNLRGTIGLSLRGVCVVMSAASAYIEVFVMSGEQVSGSVEFWGPFSIVMTMGSAAMLEAMATMMDCLIQQEG